MPSPGPWMIPITVKSAAFWTRLTCWPLQRSQPGGTVVPANATTVPVGTDPLQTYEVLATSEASSVPLALASRPLSIRVPPPEQLAPTGSTVTATSEGRPFEPLVPGLPWTPCAPMG